MKIHKPHDGKKVMCVTDKEIIGKKFEEGSKQLDFTADFYRGEPMSKEETIASLKNASMITFSGKLSVALGKEKKYIEKDHPITVKGVPQAQWLAL